MNNKTAEEVLPFLLPFYSLVAFEVTLIAYSYVLVSLIHILVINGRIPYLIRTPYETQG